MRQVLGLFLALKVSTKRIGSQLNAHDIPDAESGERCSAKTKYGIAFGLHSCKASWSASGNNGGRCVWIYDKCVPNCAHQRNQAPDLCEAGFCIWNTTERACTFDNDMNYERHSFCETLARPLHGGQESFCLGVDPGSDASWKNKSRPFDLSREWEGRTFAERVEQFLGVMPLVELQEVCHPILAGPSNGSSKLAILIHGFASCSSAWYLQAGELLNAGFIVLRPTLPGHGRLWHNKVSKAEICSHETGTIECKNGTVDKVDDISEMPMDATPYKDFAVAISLLATQFKREHPDGQVVLAGHSTGAAVATSAVLNNPHAFDRVLLLNPAYAVGVPLSQIIFRLLAGVRFSFDWSPASRCEAIHRYVGGGYCQFLVAHVAAVDRFARETYSDFRERLVVMAGERLALAFWPSIQFVITVGDSAVDNDRVRALADEMKATDASSDDNLNTGVVGQVPPANMCALPAELTHNYQFPISEPHRDHWWQQYVQEVFKEFLVDGHFIDILTRVSSCGTGSECAMCFTDKHDLYGSALVRFPATQHDMKYRLSVPSDPNVHFAKSLYQGSFFTTFSAHMNSRKYWIELVEMDKKILAILRKEPNGNVDLVYRLLQYELIYTRCVLFRGNLVSFHEVSGAGYQDETRVMARRWQVCNRDFVKAITGSKLLMQVG